MNTAVVIEPPVSQNCGIEDVQITHECCAGCRCACCGGTAIEVGGSMNDIGWCAGCTERLWLPVDAQPSPTAALTLAARQAVKQLGRAARRRAVRRGCR